MRIKEMMERAGTRESGRFFAYLLDGLLEVNTMASLSDEPRSLSLTKDVRSYEIDADESFITDIKVKGQNNDDEEYRSIPRLMHKPDVEDADGI